MSQSCPAFTQASRACAQCYAVCFVRYDARLFACGPSPAAESFVDYFSPRTDDTKYYSLRPVGATSDPAKHPSKARRSGRVSKPCSGISSIQKQSAASWLEVPLSNG